MADTSKSYSLKDFYQQAGLTDYPDWVNRVEVTPSGVRGYTPRPYQISGLNHLAAFSPRCAIWDDPGTGKTLQLQAFMIWIASLGNKCVGVMPPALVTQFQDSLINNFRGVEKHLKVGVVNGDKAERQRQIDAFSATGWADILILSYPTFLGRQRAVRRNTLTAKKQAELNQLSEEENFRARSDLAKEAAERFSIENKKYLWYPKKEVSVLNFKGEVLEHLGYNMLIADEAHKLKKPSSAIHKAVRDFVKPWEGENSNGLVLATGSPIETNVEDAFGLISLLDPTKYKSMKAFDYKHCVLLQGVRYRKVLRYKNLDYLYVSLYAKGRRVTKKQAFPDMPARVVTEVHVTLSKQHINLYNKLATEQVLELEDKLIDGTAQQRMYQYVQQILLCPEKFTDTNIKDNALLEAIADVVDSLAGRKVLIFSWYQHSILKLREHFSKHNPAVINGQVTGDKRDAEKKRFIDDPSCKMMIANPLSGGVGIDGWQTVCSYIVFAEVCPFPGAFEQSIGRLERSGQTETVNVFLFVPTNTIAVKLRNDLIKKEWNANKAVRDKKQLLSEMFSNEFIEGSFE